MAAVGFPPFWPANDCARRLCVGRQRKETRNVIELGTSTGYSALWIANAPQRTGGKLTTFEIDHERAAYARKRFMRAGVEGYVPVVECDARVKLAAVKGPIDMVFIDAVKHGDPDYLLRMLPLVRPGGLIAEAFNLGPQWRRLVMAN